MRHGIANGEDKAVMCVTDVGEFNGIKMVVKTTGPPVVVPFRVHKGVSYGRWTRPWLSKTTTNRLPYCWRTSISWRWRKRLAMKN